MIDKIVVLSVIAASPFISSTENSVSQNINSYSIEDSDELISKYTQQYSVNEKYYLKEIGINTSATAYTTCESDNMTDSEYFENIGILNEFLTLEDDWDDYGSLAPSKDIVMFVMTILSKLPKQPDVFPTPEGHVQLEYAIGKNRHLNIEFISESKFSIFEMFEDRKARKDFYSYDLQILNDRIRRFYGTYETIS